MDHDITENIAHLVLTGDNSFEQHMEEQGETLRRLKCINPFYGRLIERGAELLLSLFDLDDRDFAVRLPALAHLDKPSRQQFLRAIERHLEECEHCAITYQNELDLNARIEQACCENRELILDQLEEEIPAH